MIVRQDMRIKIVRQDMRIKKVESKQLKNVLFWERL